MDEGKAFAGGLLAAGTGGASVGVPLATGKDEAFTGALAGAREGGMSTGPWLAARGGGTEGEGGNCGHDQPAPKLGPFGGGP